MAKLKDQALETKGEVKGRVKGGSKVFGFVAGAAQLALAAYAGSDLVKRPESQINGPKALWAGALAINWVGPTAYLLLGRKETFDQVKGFVDGLQKRA
ncbi:hypothetical protein F8O06_04110 [Pseudoclavibacter sp. CFCC 14310]|uniref:PLDc N-terminal domain-containing protein n=1 Tax=Pseudoclavibacter sp. CFCC 14310 TaxID=2615180 RepID=UPI0013012E80|nr:PLDc N-terminal domain-containing protein [Pseudoclavibacter sp. CFCC 14310]KAB1645580.1 hypothetical protein F8O06_08335 [Pseudoclavibacter sp. CFCC 14310]KAB1645961.1 hypothetical protein F8O06_04110 [Pseudoclavibacter sp. CFCC 14310]